MRFGNAFVLLVLLIPSIVAAPPGAGLYSKTCAKCHGANGEGGTKEYAEPLVGNRSIPQLAKYVARTMPPDAPGSVSAADAEAIAQHMHEAFYSKEAQERNKPPRIDLARLTVQQYRLSLYDTIEAMQWSAPWGEKRGLKGEYFAA
ncbi:MAG: c-type cytochrome, partial [Gemmataceae bacterium]